MAQNLVHSVGVNSFFIVYDSVNGSELVHSVGVTSFLRAGFLANFKLYEVHALFLETQ